MAPLTRYSKIDMTCSTPTSSIFSPRQVKIATSNISPIRAFGASNVQSKNDSKKSNGKSPNEHEENIFNRSNSIARNDEEFWYKRDLEMVEELQKYENEQNGYLQSPKYSNVARKNSVRTLVVNGVRNMEDIGEIAQIINDNSNDGLISSECEKRLHEKYGLVLEHSIANDDSKLRDLTLRRREFSQRKKNFTSRKAEFPLTNGDVSFDDGGFTTFYGDHTLINETGVIGPSCGGGVISKRKFGAIIRRYSNFMPMMRRVMQKAKKSRQYQGNFCIQATKINHQEHGRITSIKSSGLTVIPENCETVGEALQRLYPTPSLPHLNNSPKVFKRQTTPDLFSRLRASGSFRLRHLDLGDGEFERTRKSEKRSSAIETTTTETAAKMAPNHNKRYSCNLASMADKVTNRNSKVGPKPSADRSSMCTEEGASTSWLLVLYSPEFAPSKNNRYSIKY